MVEIATAPPALRLVLRGDAAVAARTGAVFGPAPPTEPCRAAEADGRAALWLGPDEWLLLAPPDDALPPTLEAALAGTAHSLVDVSDGSVALVLRGPGAARALSAGCPLDLHPTAFPVGMATRTVLRRAGITLWRRGAEEWRLEVPRSLGAYAEAFLAEAARGLPAF
jgi:sarcosine oxidase subunit gamma